MSTFLIDLGTNPIFIAAAASWFVAQLTKIIIEIIKYGFNVKRLTGGGGMPSSHSATVTGLATATGIICGGGSFEFVMALFFAFIVMYDAAGVRMETGKEAKALNLLRKRDENEGLDPVLFEDLDEKMGHTLPEIIVGIVIGILTAVLICNIMP